MGSFSLQVYKKSLSLVVLLATFNTFAAQQIADVKVPDSFSCEGKELPLSGAGLRTATFFKVKVFVLAVYAGTKISTGKGAQLDQRPMCFEMTYLREFDNDDVDKAWDFQFKESSEHSYPEIGDHIKLLKSFFGEIKGKKTQSLALLEGTTKVYENGEFKGEIKGGDFQKSFLSLWYGSKPPTKELQDSLLKGVK